MEGTDELLRLTAMSLSTALLVQKGVRNWLSTTLKVEQASSVEGSDELDPVNTAAFEPG